MSGIESRFEQAWTPLERGLLTGQARYLTRQNYAKRILRWSRRRGFLLKRLDLETFERIAQAALFFFEVLFGIDAAVNREGTEIGRHVEICTCLSPPAKQQNGFSRRRRSDVVLRLAKLYFLLDVEKPRHCRQRAFERVRTFELPADVRCLPTHGGAQRNGSAVGVPNDAAGGLRR